MQPESDRGFSREQHRSGRWKTTALPGRNTLLRWCIKTISLKHRELDLFTRRCLPEYLIVDLGAGVGTYAYFLLQRCPATVIAIDWSPEALGTIPQPAAGRLLKVCADACFLPLKPSAIDALYTIDTLGHLRHQEAALDEINRVCRCGAPLFLHSECADYRDRWPDNMLIKKCGTDHLAELDGHFGIRRSREMRALYERRFSISAFFSPAGTLGWLIGYPEKYLAIFKKCGTILPSVPVSIMVFIRKLPGCRLAVRLANAWSNRIELFFGLEGGGSCFSRGRTVIPEPCARYPAPPGIDIIIPTYNRPSLTGKMLHPLVDQLSEADRLIIVWQGTVPPVIKPEDHRIIMLHRKRPNLPAARNAGVKAGGNPIVLFLDDDTAAQPGLLEQHRDAYRDPRIAAVAGGVDDPLFPAHAAVPSWFDPSTGELVQNFSLPQNGPSLTVMGANMSFRRSVLEQTGGFDPRYRDNALWEEIDVSFRIRNAGFSIVYQPAARVRHLRQSSGGCRSSGSTRYLFHQFANTAYFACTYMPLRHTRSWLRFWKYRLEYLSRKPGIDVGEHKKYRHRPMLVAAGLTGAACGCCRFIIAGKRLGLPAFPSATAPYRDGGGSR